MPRALWALHRLDGANHQLRRFGDAQPHLMLPRAQRKGAGDKPGGRRTKTHTCHVHIPSITAEIPPANPSFPLPKDICQVLVPERRRGLQQSPHPAKAPPHPPAPHFASRSTQGQRILSLPSASAMISAFQEQIFFFLASQPQMNSSGQKRADSIPCIPPFI